jgi:hypothetical protein
MPMAKMALPNSRWVVHGGAQCHLTGADDRQDAHLIWVPATEVANGEWRTRVLGVMRFT